MTETTDPRLAPGGNFPPEEVETEEDRLLEIDPENLVVISPDRLPKLFELHYPDLKERAAKMLATCQKWQQDHKSQAGGWLPIQDDAENGRVGDLVVQLDDFAKEVDETRKAVKEKIYLAGQQIDGWFTRGLSEPVMDIRGVTRTVSGKRYPPGPGTLQFSQTAYLTAKAEAERLAREAAAKAAEVEAKRKADEARLAAEQEQQRIATLRYEGLSADEAQQIAYAEIDQASAAADNALASAAEVSAYASEPAGALVKQHTATGTTIGLGGRWTFEVTNLAELCLAVAAPLLMRDDLAQRVAAGSQIGVAGAQVVLRTLASLFMPNGVPVPASFVTTDDKQIRAALTAKTAPLREAPGVRVYQEMAARRRGG
jgi:hypothetical protein